MSLKRFRRLCAAGFVFAIVGCLDLTGANPAGGNLIEIAVTQGATVQVGDTVRLAAVGHVDGLLGLFSYDPVRDARWVSSNTAIATLETPPAPAPTDTLWTAHILVRGRRAGDVTVTAAARGVRGHAIVRVIP